MNDRPISSEWCTPQWLFDELNKEFNFDIDLCATKENSKLMHYCSNYLNDEHNSRAHDTSIQRSLKDIVAATGLKNCFMNPPYSNPKPFIEKAWEDSKHCKIVCLVKCDPSTRWWATFWNYTNTIDLQYYADGSLQ